MQSGSSPDSAVIDPSTLPLPTNTQATQQTLLAGRELMLECVTPELGQPSANLWLWFMNNQPIEFSMIEQQNQPSPFGKNQENPAFPNRKPASNNDNSIRVSSTELPQQQQQQQRHTNSITADPERRTRNQFDSDSSNEPEASRRNLINSGRYLYIPSIRLAHKGNYSCVAVNRLGSRIQQPADANGNGLERDEYQLRVASSPTFIQSLPHKIYWPQVAADPSTSDQANANNERQLEIVCHVQCEPICHIEWLKNNQPLDLAPSNRASSLVDDSRSPTADEMVSYQVENTVIGENVAMNKFKSIESRLVFKIYEDVSVDSNNVARASNSLDRRARKTPSELRRALTGINYTCQSSANFAGPAVKSTTRLVIQCK